MIDVQRAVPAIRMYQEKDRDQVRKICIQTAPEILRQNEMMQQLVLRAFCDYYIEQEPQHCFVAVNENDEAVGYILCATDAREWYRIFSQQYIAPIENDGARGFLEKTCEACLSAAEDYAAHLHTDILPDYQRRGLGKSLMNMLIEQLRSQQVKGLMLSVGNENIGAQRFYEKMGFSEIDRRPTETVMGIKI